MVSRQVPAGRGTRGDGELATARADGAARVRLCGDADLSLLLEGPLRGDGFRLHTDAGGGGADGADAGCAAAAAALGGIDAMVYAGLAPRVSAATATSDVLTLTSAQAGGFLAHAREAVRVMAAARTAGNLVCICDIAGIAGRAGQTAAATASGALLGMTRALAKELGRQRISVNAIACGPIAVGGDDAGALTTAERELFAAMGLGGPLAPAELARTLGLLVSGGHGMTGQVLRLDHGLVI
jgi:NAD(P)-dependent dehydrogenase (short-subunit alcohol dehydrogenase family)